MPKIWDILKPTSEFSLNFAVLQIIIIFLRNKPSRKVGCADSLGRFKAFMLFSVSLFFNKYVNPAHVNPVTGQVNRLCAVSDVPMCAQRLANQICVAIAVSGNEPFF